MLRISTRNARFQQWQALLGNRAKRQRAGLFLVHGVRPINLAVAHGWRIDTLIHPAGGALSEWATGLLDRVPATRVAMDAGLLRELAERDEATPELVAVVAMPPDDLDRVPVSGRFLAVVLDRPGNPGNIGTLVRSADAFGASGVVVTGHAADAYDPRAVRASTGSLFAVPVVRVPSHREVLGWLAGHRIPVLGTDEHGEADLADQDLTGPVAVVIGNETAGLSVAWRQACDRLVRIPIGGSASSLNAAAAGTVVLYEAARQRGATS